VPRHSVCRVRLGSVVQSIQRDKSRSTHPRPCSPRTAPPSWRHAEADGPPRGHEQHLHLPPGERATRRSLDDHTTTRGRSRRDRQRPRRRGGEARRPASALGAPVQLEPDRPIGPVPRSTSNSARKTPQDHGLETRHTSLKSRSDRALRHFAHGISYSKTVPYWYPGAALLAPIPGTGAIFVNTANGIRTRVTAVRGRRPSPLDDGGMEARPRLAKPQERARWARRQMSRSIADGARRLSWVARAHRRTDRARSEPSRRAISSHLTARGCGGIGRRARFRSVSRQLGGGSSPLIRILENRLFVHPRGACPTSRAIA
jgi:hypothetical protein